jgi:type IV pilus assembly protein PilV
MEIAQMVDGPKQHGAGMIETLMTMAVVTVGLLGLIQLMMRSTLAEFESYQRAQALVLLNDMVDKINSNRKAAGCYAITTNTASGAPYLGTGSAGAPPCTAWGTAAEQARALADLNDWNAKLLGSGETLAGAAAGAMQGARGCVTYDPVSNTFQVSVAWQGNNGTVAATSVDPSLVCGLGLYGPETKRRIVASALTIASLR